MGKAVLAQYTIRSKQDYIFRTNRIVEVVGASVNIRDAWKKFFEVADSMGLSTVKAADKAFSESDIKKGFEEGTLNLVELFCGGGNETVMIDSEETFRSLNREYTYLLMKEFSGMIPMAVCVEAEWDYKLDYKHLMEKAETVKNSMISGQETFILPFSMMDREIFRPLTQISKMEGEEQRYSEEGYSKRIRGLEERNKDNAVKYLDDMVTKKGEESLLAIIHADGNNMGTKIMNMLSNKSDYDGCVALMREFTEETAKAFGEAGIRAIEEKKKELTEAENNPRKKSSFEYRVIVRDGDDMTFICNARYAMDYVAAYIKAVQNYQTKWQYSSCAGICIFHSHYPFSKAYALAEQACDDGAKQMVHRTDKNGKAVAVEQGWVDFHYVHSGVGGKLKEIRNTQNTEGCMARPWCLTEENGNRSYKKLLQVKEIIGKNNVSRTKVKNIGIACEESSEEARKQLKQVSDHIGKGLYDDLLREFDGDEDVMLKTIYDFSEMYDLWYGEEA